MASYSLIFVCEGEVTSTYFSGSRVSLYNYCRSVSNNIGMTSYDLIKKGNSVCQRLTNFGKVERAFIINSNFSIKDVDGSKISCCLKPLELEEFCYGFKIKILRKINNEIYKQEFVKTSSFSLLEDSVLKITDLINKSFPIRYDDREELAFTYNECYRCTLNTNTLKSKILEQESTTIPLDCYYSYNGDPTGDIISTIDLVFKPLEDEWC